MTDDRLEFYDPLYETITFEQGLPYSGFNLRREEAKEDPLDPRDLVQSAEFARLAFLRQAGLAWLVFPSATHTRFAHSIGCWWLGRIAETLIKVKFPTGERHETRSLKWWLARAGLREEFYLALLFHDIGHGPFSHVLEHNVAFADGLKEVGVNSPDHEHRGASLLRGDGLLAETWKGIAVQRYGDSVRTLSQLRPKLESVGDLCIGAVCYLMTSDESYLESCTHPHQEGLFVVKELVSGLLDLDRLDHYARDSYFSGLRQVSVNVRGFLSNLRVKLPFAGSRDPLLSLTDDGASYAASLLFSKRQILSTMFRNPKTVALHAMANWTLTTFLREFGINCGKECARIALMEDDQFLEAMISSANLSCRYLARRIRSMSPYVMVGRWSKSALKARHETVRSALQSLEESVDNDRGPRVLVHYDKAFWASARPESRDWLDTGHLLMESTDDFLTNHPDHASDFHHLRETDNIGYLWIFARDRPDVDEVRSTVEGILLRGKLDKPTNRP
jgi:HD superfamily phosphohydrolase